MKYYRDVYSFWVKNNIGGYLTKYPPKSIESNEIDFWNPLYYYDGMSISEKIGSIILCSQLAHIYSTDIHYYKDLSLGLHENMYNDNSLWDLSPSEFCAALIPLLEKQGSRLCLELFIRSVGSPPYDGVYLEFYKRLKLFRIKHEHITLKSGSFWDSIIGRLSVGYSNFFKQSILPNLNIDPDANILLFRDTPGSSLLFHGLVDSGRKFSVVSLIEPDTIIEGSFIRFLCTRYDIPLIQCESPIIRAEFDYIFYIKAVFYYLERLYLAANSNPHVILDSTAEDLYLEKKYDLDLNSYIVKFTRPLSVYTLNRVQKLVQVYNLPYLDTNNHIIELSDN